MQVCFGAEGCSGGLAVCVPTLGWSLIVPLLGSVEQAAVVRSHDAGESAFVAPFTILQQASKYSVLLDGVAGHGFGA